jgi:asparagine synthase (glutamine-hydrolysing)
MMCGICGFVGEGTVDDLRRMTAALRHRGPDGEGHHEDRENGVFLGHRRLSIIDIEGGAQPMWTPDGSLGVVFNGEIYNHLDLRQRLMDRGHRFETDHSDTEVLLHGYRQWGAGLPERLNGMWAFAIYDRTRMELFLSRDRFGKKPLFYTVQRGTFAFASELTALAKHPSVPTSRSRRSLKKYFAYGFIPAPNSIFSDVFKLPGGCNLQFSIGDFSHRIRKYWELVLEPDASISAEPEARVEERIRELLDRAVQRRLMADVPLGVFLSGGIDSSAIAAFAARAVGADRLKTFSIGFSEESFDESEYARRVADLLGTDHHARRFSVERARSILPEVVSHLDEPMGDSSILPTSLLSRETRRHVTVALGGDGGDELFAGYDPFRALKMAEIYRRLVPKPLHHGIRMAASRLPVSHRNMSLDFRINRTLRGLSYPKQLWNPVWLGPLEPAEIDSLFAEPTDIEDIYSEAIEHWDACGGRDLVDQTLQFYTRLYLQDDILVKADRASMMHSLEVRAPFLDIDLVDFVRRIPADWKYRNGRTKYILKKALTPLLPEWVIHRPKKGFGVPVGQWFREGHLWPDGDVAEMGLNGRFVIDQLNAHREQRGDHRLFLWNAWLLQRWSGRFPGNGIG